MIVKINRMYCLFSVLTIGMAAAVIMFQLHFWLLPLVLLVLGAATGFFIKNEQHVLLLFILVFPFINSSPGLISTVYPFNYLAPSLFLLSGLVMAGVMRRFTRNVGLDAERPAQDENLHRYYIFLIFLVLSAVFLLLRWSNIYPGNYAAAGADTPVAPGTWLSPDSQRVSFGIIFPVVSLFIFFISPYLYLYVRKVKPEAKAVFRALSYGYYISVAMAAAQWLSGKSLISDRLGKVLKQFYGGFSDFNAFGFFAGVMIVWSTYEIRAKNRLGLITLPAALLGGILSGSRTVYFFILAGLFSLATGYLRNHKKEQRLVILAVFTAVLALVIIFGGTLQERLQEGLDREGGWLEKLDGVTNGRVWMTRFTVNSILDYPLQGIGAGNFTFYLAYKNYLPYKETGKKYLIDLSLNQYLQIFVENGLFAFLAFTGFLLHMQRRSTRKWLTGAILFALLFNNFFWFPENFLLFWLAAGLFYARPKSQKPQDKAARSKYRKVATVGSMVIFILMNAVSHQILHPSSWMAGCGLSYDYGFSYEEKEPRGKRFRWSFKESGLMIRLNEEGKSPVFEATCGAPLEKLPGRRQQVKVFWKGLEYKIIHFIENRTEMIQIEGKPGEKGFLEFETQPVFSLRELGLGSESRRLGVRISKRVE